MQWAKSGLALRNACTLCGVLRVQFSFGHPTNHPLRILGVFYYNQLLSVGAGALHIARQLAPTIPYIDMYIYISHIDVIVRTRHATASSQCI